MRDTTGQRNRGLLRKADLADWRARYDDPVTLQYGRYTVAKCGVWSQGPVHLQQLALLRHLQMDGLDPASPQFVHRIAEAAKPVSYTHLDVYKRQALRRGTGRN